MPSKQPTPFTLRDGLVSFLKPGEQGDGMIMPVGKLYRIEGVDPSLHHLVHQAWTQHNYKAPELKTADNAGWSTIEAQPTFHADVPGEAPGLLPELPGRDKPAQSVTEACPQCGHDLSQGPCEHCLPAAEQNQGAGHHDDGQNDHLVQVEPHVANLADGVLIDPEQGSDDGWHLDGIEGDPQVHVDMRHGAVLAGEDSKLQWSEALPLGLDDHGQQPFVHVAQDTPFAESVKPGGEYFVWLNGEVAFDQYPWRAAQQLALKHYPDRVAYIENTVARNATPLDTPIAIGEVIQGRPQIYLSNVDRNHVWDAVMRALDGGQNDANSADLSQNRTANGTHLTRNQMVAHSLRTATFSTLKYEVVHYPKDYPRSPTTSQFMYAEDAALWLSEQGHPPEFAIGRNVDDNGHVRPMTDEESEYFNSIMDRRYSTRNATVAHSPREATQDVPPAPGTTPIPEGYIRLYHYTDADPDAIRAQGLDIGHARGHSYQEPNRVWASYQMPDPTQKNFAEFAVPWNDPRWEIGRANSYEDAAAGERYGRHVTFTDSIKPEEILAVHEPWHHHYRYAVENNLDPNEYDWVHNMPGYEDYARAFDALRRRTSARRHNQTDDSHRYAGMRYARLRNPFGFFKFAADIEALAQKAYQNLEKREDIKRIIELGNILHHGDPRAAEGKRLDRQEWGVYQFMEMIGGRGEYDVAIPPETYKLWEWLVSRIKRGEFDMMQNRRHVVDILVQATKWMQWSKEYNQPTPDWKRFDWEQMQQWVYDMNGKDLTSESQWTNEHKIYQFPDGWYMAEVSPEDCKLEGELMGHCVGGYGHQIANGTSYIVSLRDPKGNPHVTLEMIGEKAAAYGNGYGRPTWYVQQIQGKQDREPIDEYKAYIKQWFDSLKDEGLDVAWADDSVQHGDGDWEYGDPEIDDSNTKHLDVKHLNHILDAHQLIGDEGLNSFNEGEYGDARLIDDGWDDAYDIAGRKRYQETYYPEHTIALNGSMGWGDRGERDDYQHLFTLWQQFIQNILAGRISDPEQIKDYVEGFHFIPQTHENNGNFDDPTRIRQGWNGNGSPWSWTQIAQRTVQDWKPQVKTPEGQGTLFDQTQFQDRPDPRRVDLVNFAVKYMQALYSKPGGSYDRKYDPFALRRNRQLAQGIPYGGYNPNGPNGDTYRQNAQAYLPQWDAQPGMHLPGVFSKVARADIERYLPDSLRTSMAYDPEQWAKDMPKVLYHGTYEDAAQRIMREGLKPWDELGGSNYSDHLEPRPGHVYLTDDPTMAHYHALRQTDGTDARPVVLVIDPRTLDPQHINPDEDSWYERNEPYDGPGEQPDALLDGKPTDTSLGQWAEDTGYGDNENHTQWAYNDHGNLAYRGTIFPEAMRYATPEEMAEWERLNGHTASTKTADYQGWTNWETWNTALMMDNEQSLYNTSREMIRNGLQQHMTDEQLAQMLEQWSITHIIVPENAEAMKSAQEWNDIPPEERIDYHYEELTNKSPEAADIVNQLGFGPNVDDTEPMLMDPAKVNWYEIVEHMKDEELENWRYEQNLPWQSEQKPEWWPQAQPLTLPEGWG